jgi:hypothetical protein
VAGIQPEEPLALVVVERVARERHQTQHLERQTQAVVVAAGIQTLILGTAVPAL